jgi:hypothetical protein
MILNNNSLEGPFPWGGGGFPQLQLMRVDGNRLSGALPANLSLPALLVLRAFANSLTGRLDEAAFAGMPRLQILALQGNKLAGPLPPRLVPSLQEM